MPIEYDDFSHPIKSKPAVVFDEKPPSVEKLVTLKLLQAEHSESKLTEVENALAKQTNAKLHRALQKALLARNRLSAWLINCEFTFRGIPPVFRDLPEPDSDKPDQYLDLLTYDLEWIAKSLPKHKTLYERWQKFTDKRYFHSTALFIFNGMGRGKFRISKATKGLSLTDAIQVECNLLKLDKQRSRLEQLKRLSEEVKEHLKDKHTLRLLKSSSIVMLKNEDLKIINRRTNIWLCANLAKWSPVLTGRYYDALTGYPDKGVFNDDIPMSRQRAAKFIADVIRDLPKNLCRI